jgi:SAM-dependent methyltransferase
VTSTNSALIAPSLTRVLTVATRRTADLRVVCGDMRSLPVRPRSCSAAVAFYSVQHVPRAAIRGVLSEIRRVLRPRGMLILATHLGEGDVHPTELLGHHIEPVGGTLYRTEELERALVEESFVVEDLRYRDPLPHEHQSRRIYVTARLGAA